MTVSRTKMGFISDFFFLLILTHEVTCLDSDVLDLPQNLQTLLGKKTEAKVDNPSSEVQEIQDKAHNKPEDVGESKSDQLLAELKKGLAMEKQSRVVLEETVDQLKRRFLAERTRGANLEIKVQQLENSRKTVKQRLELEKTRGANLEVKVQQLENGQKTVKEELEAEKTNRGELEMSIRQMNNTLWSLNKAETSAARTGVTTSPQNVPTGGVTVCPSGWSAFGSSCYYFQPRRKRLSRDGAERKCKEKHSESTLVSIETADEYKFLKNVLKGEYESVKRGMSNGWMTSGIKVGGSWEWSATGDRLNFSTVKWTKGRPKSLWCVSLWPPKFDLTDVYCEKFSRQFICELALRSD